MGRETFTDHEGNEAPEFEVEEEEEEEAGGKAKSEKKPSKDEDDADGDDDAAAKGKAEKAGDGDEEEEIEDEDDLKARLAEQEEENARLRDHAHKTAVEKTESELEQAKYLSGALTKQIDSIRASIVEARKDEDVEKQAKLEGELDQAKDAKTQTDKLIEEQTTKLSRIKDGGPDTEGRGDRGARPGAPLTGKAKDWVSRNKWMNEAGNEVERVAVMVIDQQLAKEGLNRNTDRYYAELSRRVSKKFPGLKVRHLDGKEVVKTTRKPGGDGRKGVHGQQGTAGKSGSSPPGKPKFEAEDRVKMRKWGLDPANKDHVKHWLRSKAEVAAQEARRDE